MEGSRQPLSSDCVRGTVYPLLHDTKDRSYCYLCFRDKKTGLEVDTGRQQWGQGRIQAYLTPIPVFFPLPHTELGSSPCLGGGLNTRHGEGKHSTDFRRRD